MSLDEETRYTLYQVKRMGWSPPGIVADGLAERERLRARLAECEASFTEVEATAQAALSLVWAVERAYDHGNLEGDLLDAWLVYQGER